MAAEVEDRGPIPNLALNAILIPVLDDTSEVRSETYCEVVITSNTISGLYLLTIASLERSLNLYVGLYSFTSMENL